DFILRTFPNARFVHLIRDARAVVASFIRVSPNWGESWASKSVDQPARTWVKLVKAGRRILDLVSAPAPYFEVKYAGLRTDPETQFAKLFHWLNLSAEEDLLRSAIDLNRIEKTRTDENPFASIPMRKEPLDSKSQKPAYPNAFIGPAPYRLKDVELTRLQR